MVEEVYKPLPWFNEKNKSESHSIEQHNYWAERKRPCPYCLSGSKPVPKAMIVERLNRR